VNAEKYSRANTATTFVDRAWRTGIAATLMRSANHAESISPRQWRGRCGSAWATSGRCSNVTHLADHVAVINRLRAVVGRMWFDHHIAAIA
jgi:hypothetical protein